MSATSRFDAARIGPAAVFVALVALYATTACRTVGPGDSGELTVVMTSWSVAHAPGYPLLSLIGNLVSLVPFPGEPAFALNLLSGVFAAAAAALITGAVLVLTGSVSAGVVAGLALGTSRVYWEYALVAEVFGLNSLCAALLLFLAARFLRGWRDGRPPLSVLPWAGFVLATAITHHLTLILVALPLLALVGSIVIRLDRDVSWPVRLRFIGLATAAGVVGLLPLLYLPLAARGQPVLNWDNPVDLAGVLYLLRREDFGSGTLMSPWSVAATVLDHGESAAPLSGHHLWRYFAEIPRNFGWFFIPAAVAGAVWAALRCRILLVFLGGFLAMLVIFFLRVNSPVLPLYLGITERFYILPNVVVAFFGGLGIAWAAGALKTRTAPGRLFPFVAAAATSLAMISVHGRDVDMRGNTFTRDFGANLIAGAPENAILLCEGDLLHNAFYYQQSALGKRPDLVFVDQQKLTYPWYVNRLRREGRFRLPDDMTRYSSEPATQSRRWIDLNLEGVAEGGRPIVTSGLRDPTYYEEYRIVPSGIWWRVVHKSDVPAPSTVAADLERVIEEWDLSSLDRHYHERSWEKAKTPIYTRGVAFLGAALDLDEDLRSGDTKIEPGPTAEQWFSKAGAMANDAAAVLALRAEFYHRSLADGLPDLGPFDGTMPLMRKAIRIAEEAVRIDPENAAALQTLATLLPADPENLDRHHEIEIRGRLADQHPGSVAVLSGYVQAVIDLMNDPETRAPALMQAAIHRQERLVRLLDIAFRLTGDATYQRSRDQWQGYVNQSKQQLAGQ